MDRQTERAFAQLDLELKRRVAALQRAVQCEQGGGITVPVDITEQIVERAKRFERYLNGGS